MSSQSEPHAQGMYDKDLCKDDGGSSIGCDQQSVGYHSSSETVYGRFHERQHLRHPCADSQPTKTSLQLKYLARQYLTSLEKRLQQKPREVLECWAKVVQAPYASLTRAVKFEAGVLHVAVRHSTLLSILHSPAEKARLIQALRKEVPDARVQDIVFRIG